MPTNYIGFTDPRTEEDVRRALAAIPPLTNIKLHVGLMGGPPQIANLFKNVWLPMDQIHQPFIDHPQVMNTFHYADLGKEIPAIFHTYVQACGQHLHAIQFDMVWPLPYNLMIALSEAEDSYKEKYGVPKSFEVILQVGKLAFKEINHDVDSLITRLLQYGRSITHVLLDCSCGMGEPLDAHKLLLYIEEIRTRLPQLGIAVAGGLGPDTIDLLEPILRKYGQSNRPKDKFISCDAQGKLRHSGKSTDPIDIDRVVAYRKKAYELYTTHYPLL